MQNDSTNGSLTLNPTNVGCALGTTSTITTTANSAHSINGKFGTVYAAAANAAATSPTINAATGAAFTSMSPNKATVIVVGLNAAGQVRLAQGSVEDTEVGVTTTKGAFKLAPQFPVLPDDFCPIAYGLIRTAPDAAAWTCGTSSWTASGVFSGLNGTTTLQNVNGTLPDRPAIA